jgi:cell division protein FtsW (lipid II flippase)
MSPQNINIVTEVICIITVIFCNMKFTLKQNIWIYVLLLCILVCS